jgi:predicted metalloprotease with PDZ domain
MLFATLLVVFACRSATPATSTPTPTPTAASTAPLDIAYRIAMPDPAEHLYSIEIAVGNLNRDTILLQLPVWSPGRYARFDFARNVQDFTVVASDRAIRWDKVNGSLWRIYPSEARAVTVRYRVFANDLSGTFSVLDTAHANWNGASLFMYVEGHKPDPVRLHVDLPAGWHVINGDTRTNDQVDYRFENYDRLIDAPTEIAAGFMVDSFRVDSRLYRAMLHHNGPVNAATRQRFVRDVERIVRYENTVFGPPPLEMYTFLFNLGYQGRDGMEHLYSTQIQSTRPLVDTAVMLSGISSAAHEYFHVWNVKRVRPLALGPFDYAKEQYQPSLWVAEGWTQYYGTVAPYRAGIIGKGDFYASMANGVFRPNLTAPSRKQLSARMESFHAPFWDGSRPEYQTNGQNTFFSYYTKGAGLASVLDLMIRGASGNARSLDDAARNLKRLSWDQPNASYYLQGRGYTEADVEHAVSEAMGRDMHDWFERHVGGTEDPPIDDALALAGLRLIRSESSWSIEEMSDATAAQRAVRDGWLTGKVR